MENKKIIKILTVLIIIIGIIMLVITRFNKSIIYKSGTKIEISIEKGYNKADIEQLVKESFPNRDFIVQDIEKLNQVASIKIQSYTEEELNTFKTKISEKYEIEKDKLVIYEIKVPATRIRTIIKPYVLPVSLVTILTLAYIGIRNIKNGEAIKKVVQLLTILVEVAGIFFSIMVIAKLQFNEYTMPTSLMIYLVTLILGTIKINK